MQDKTNSIREPFGVQFNPQNSDVIDELLGEDKYFSRHITAYHYGCYGSDDEDTMNDFIAAIGDKIGSMPLHVKGIQQEGRKRKTMNLKENYERFFKQKLEEKKEVKSTKLTESEKVRFENLVKVLSRKYPAAPLSIREGHVFFGFKKIETTEKFFSRKSLQIQEMVRSFANSNKKGLI